MAPLFMLPGEQAKTVYGPSVKPSNWKSKTLKGFGKKSKSKNCSCPTKPKIQAIVSKSDYFSLPKWQQKQLKAISKKLY